MHVVPAIVRRRESPLSLVLDDLDAPKGTTAIAKDVLLDVVRRGRAAAGVVDNLNRLVPGVKGRLAEVGHAAGPLDGPRARAGQAGDPGAELDLHGGLGVAGAALGVGVVEGADDDVVDEPVDLLGGPVDGVGVEGVDGGGHGVERAAVVGGHVALAEVVGLDLGVVAAEPLPVDLVEVGGLEDDGGDDADSRAGLELDIDAAEEDVLLQGDGGGLAFPVDVEEGAVVGVVGEVGASEVVEVGTVAVLEFIVELLVAQSRGGRAVYEFMLVSLPLFRGAVISYLSQEDCRLLRSELTQKVPGQQLRIMTWTSL